MKGPREEQMKFENFKILRCLEKMAILDESNRDKPFNSLVTALREISDPLEIWGNKWPGQ